MTRKQDLGFRLRNDIACREVEGEWYILTADGAFHAVTDPVGSTVIRLVAGKPGISLSSLVSNIKRRFETEGEDVGADLRMFTEELVAKGIFEKTSSSVKRGKSHV